ncbi:PREDICTED: protein SHQ1 homolog [Nicrophorus vespilloides]|uniref:Protein SHQ1 homolog n=1 Tax=Nicrophorus vespilloides TaxID=110193 RepID=A0ABM1NFT6_NICVS|nr:PREDICTED: protein SHQ1 homolog [Nicrophorus vespilloides]
MLTPRFELTQTEKTLSIQVRAPYCSLGDLDVSVEENVFIFVCKPYYLRLHLPGKIEENDNSHSKFDADLGVFTFTYEKVTPGEQFEDLEFITKFLCPKIEVQEGNRKIEILTSEDCNDDAVVVESEEKYGFAQRGGYNFAGVSSEFYDIFKVDPHEVKLEDRRGVRLKQEAEDFDLDHCVADLIDCEEIKEITQAKSPYDDLDAKSVKFTVEELDFLKDLINIEYNLSENQTNYCYTSLVEILFAYCYDFRTTFFEKTCESGWTIAKLSASFSYFEGFKSVKEAVICGYRRSLIYPLYRNMDLSHKVFEDLKKVLSLGEKFILKLLMEMYKVFVGGDSSRYVLNNLFVKDYVNYIMKWDKAAWAKVVEEVNAMTVSAEDLNLELPSMSDCNLTSMMSGMTIKENVLDSDDDEDESSSDSSSCSCSSSSSEESSDDSSD